MPKRKSTFISKNKLLHFAVTFIFVITGIYYVGLNYVPQKWYEEQTMMPNQVEAYYVNQWCTNDFGRKEAVLWDLTRVDCLAKDYAIEFDDHYRCRSCIGDLELK